MKFTIAISALFAAATSATSVAYDTGYDQAGRSMTAVACSDGANGLITRYGYQTQGAIPKFPLVGAYSDVAGWNSPNCGNCYSATYNGKTINFLAIDHSANGAVLSLAAMNKLTGNQATQLGRVDAVIKKVAFNNCGLPHKRDVDGRLMNEFDA